MDKILKEKKNGTEYKLIAFELLERGIPRKRSCFSKTS